MAAALVGPGPRAVLARCCRAAGLAAYSSVPAGSTGEGQQREGEGGGAALGLRLARVCNRGVVFFLVPAELQCVV